MSQALHIGPFARCASFEANALTFFDRMLIDQCQRSSLAPHSRPNRNRLHSSNDKARTGAFCIRSSASVVLTRAFAHIQRHVSPCARRSWRVYPFQFEPLEPPLCEGCKLRRCFRLRVFDDALQQRRCWLRARA